MSIEAVAAVFSRRDLSSTEKLVALRLAERAHADGSEAWPSVATIAADTGLAPRSVQGALGRLLEKGAIRRTGVHPRYRTFVYQVVLATPALPAPPQEMHPAVDAPPQDVPPPPAAPAPSPPQQVQETPAAPAPEPPLNLPGTSLEPSVAPRAPDTVGRKVDLLFDAVCKACDINPSELTSAARGPLNRAVKDLKSVGATPIEVPKRAQAYRDEMPDVTLSPMALAKWWPKLGPNSKRQAAASKAPTGRSLSEIAKARQK